jgi:hypothetical protein
VPAELVDAMAISIQDQSNEQPEFAIAQHGDFGGAGQRHLIQYFARGRQGFHENGALRGELIRQRMQIAFRQSQKLAKRAGMVDDAENGSAWAMPAQAATAPLAPAAGQVDLANHAASNQRGRIRLDHLADELMAGRAGKAVITALEFQIGIADASAEQADESEARGPVGARLVVYFYASVFQVYG